MKQKIVIVGAGLGGCVLAHALRQTHDVTIVERGPSSRDAQPPMIDAGWPAGMEPHIGFGLGGSTQLWHNGLIEIEEEIFDTFWPISKKEIGAFYDEAFQLLSKVPAQSVRNAILDLRQRYRAVGLPDVLLPGLFYPRWPINVWAALHITDYAQVTEGEVIGIEADANGRIASLSVAAHGRVQQIRGDVFVFAAGGLGTPVLLQRLATVMPLPALMHAGRHYEDHPMTFVGEVKVNVPLYRLWNFLAPGTGGNLRMPLVLRQDGLHISFYLRPAATYYRDSRRQRIDSVINELRQHMWNPAKYFKLLTHWDDVLDLLSFKFGIRVPTKHYTLLMLAQMPTTDECSVCLEIDPTSGREVVRRNWVLDESFITTMRNAIDALLEQLGPVVESSRVFADWPSTLKTGAHHSGTARMSHSAESGVCDSNCRVHGIPNLYVCDGSVIPASGIANTGLTIAALGLRLGKHLQSTS